MCVCVASLAVTHTMQHSPTHSPSVSLADGDLILPALSLGVALGLFRGTTGLLIILLGPLEPERSGKTAECCFTILAGGLSGGGGGGREGWGHAGYLGALDGLVLGDGEGGSGDSESFSGTVGLFLAAPDRGGWNNGLGAEAGTLPDLLGARDNLAASSHSSSASSAAWGPSEVLAGL